MRNIDGMMDSIADSREFEPLSEERTEALLARTLMKLQKERKKQMNIRKKVSLLLLAGIIAIGAVSAGAGAYLRMDGRLIDFLKPASDAQLEQLQPAGTAIGRQVTVNDYTVDVKESIGDNYQIYVLFDVIAPEGTTLDHEQYRFDAVRLWSEKNKSMGYSVDMLQDDQPADNKVSMVLEANCDRSFTKDRVRLDLENLVYYDPETMEDVVVEEGLWQVEFDLEYKDISKTLKVNKPIQIFGGEATLRSVSISPLSVTAEVKGPAVRKYDDQLPEDDGLEDIRIQLRDGTVVEPRTSSSGSRYFTMQQTCTFDRMIDLEQIQSIQVFGETIESDWD